MMKTIDFSKYLSLKVGKTLPVSVIDSFDYDKNLQILGFGFNLLISPAAKNLAILSDQFDYIKDLGEEIEIGAACASAKIFKFFKDRDLGGFEFLRSLPGSLGGLVKMNAGMKDYEMKNLLKSVLIDGKWVDVKDLEISYRKSEISGIIFAARFNKVSGFREEVLEACLKMRKTHPREPSCGSCFKNPQGDFAGRLLEKVGLKGYRIGGMGFSDKHANFLVNYDREKATYEDAIKLIKNAQDRVYEVFGIRLEKEVIIIE